MVPSHDSTILILGSGCFGTSTAYHLLQRGYTNVTILDKSPSLPAPDAGSNDINRIVRSSYADSFYAQLAREAIELWKMKEVWGDAYHESGVVVLGANKEFLHDPSNDTQDLTGVTESTYAEGAYLNDIAIGGRVSSLLSGKDISSVFPSTISLGSFENKSGYLNRDGGWANAGQGLEIMIGKVRSLGGNIYSGKQVEKIVVEQGKCKAVVCSDGSHYAAEVVVIATGSWTPSVFPDLNVKDAFLATGQCIAMVQLSHEEADRYRDVPVFLDFDTGFYVFPPTEKNIVKVAIHSAGYTHTVDNISTPRTISSHREDGLAIPKTEHDRLKRHLAQVYPEISEKEFTGTRMCWYNDSKDGDWVISKHPDIEGVAFATAGSGHAYKFLPVIGRVVADLLEDRLDPQTAAKFAIDRTIIYRDTSRTGSPQELNLQELLTANDKS
ncbi:FAD dependent oxidoreductase [Coprinopsis marcescibilis]|uniref:FAD dependent oxidoreductase n=1 Tax=Coprinopsis marcescibilis TaxID=230819 RepID=A0A5C3KKL6_COPMA|nr:FAD dependent oxidoreductase [Coprinopsis marcescibilis]